MDIPDIIEALAKCRDKIDQAYWIFTRTARGKPPSMTVPHEFERLEMLEKELKEAQARERNRYE